MKKILIINLLIIISVLFLTKIFYNNVQSLLISIIMVMILFIVGNFLLSLVQKRNNNLFVAFLALSYYMFYLKSLLIFIDHKFSIYYKLNLEYKYPDFIISYLIITSLFMVIYFSYGSVKNKKILTPDLEHNTIKYSLIILLTFLAIMGKYFFSTTFNYGLPGKIPYMFLIPGLGGFIYLLLAELSRIGMLYIFVSGEIQKKKKYVYISLLLMLVHSVLSTLNGVKGEVIYLAIGIFVYYFIFSSKKITFSKMLLLMFVSVFLYTTADFIRNSISFSNQNINYFEVFIKIIRRSTGFDSILNIVKFYGYQLFTFYYNDSNPIRYFTVNIAGVPENAISAAAPTFFGYFLIKGGYFLSIIAAFAFGKFIKWFDKFIRDRLLKEKNIIYIIVYLNTIFFFIDFFFEGNLIVATKRLIISICIFVIFYVFRASRNISEEKFVINRRRV